METTELMIEKIVAAVAEPMATGRQTHYLRECLHHLVRMAKLEHSKAKRDAPLAINVPATYSAKKSKIATRQLLASLMTRQRKLDFEAHAPE